jgi:hypothetical protein
MIVVMIGVIFRGHRAVAPDAASRSFVFFTQKKTVKHYRKRESTCSHHDDSDVIFTVKIESSKTACSYP